MFKLFSKFMMFMLVLAMAGPFIMKRPNGDPLMSLNDILPKFEIPSLSELWKKFGGEASSTNAPGAEAPEANDPGPRIAWSNDKPLPSSFIAKAGVEYPRKDGVYYRYKDSNGIWQFSDAPQVGIMNYVSTIDPNANIIQSLNKEKIDNALGRAPPPEVVKAGEKDKATPETPSLPFPSSVPIAEIPNLIQQAKDVQNLANERLKNIDQSTGRGR